MKTRDNSNNFQSVIIFMLIWLIMNSITNFFWKLELTDNKTLLMILLAILENSTFQKYKFYHTQKNLIAFLLSSTALIAILLVIGTRVM